MQYFSQNSFHTLKDAELLKLTLLAAKTEKEATLALLDYLVEIDSRRLYATVNACSSLFEYLVKELGFSHPAASERVNAVRLIRAVPLVKEHLETGKLTLTTAAQIQRFVNAEQKVDPKGRTISAEEKLTVIDACLGKSKRDVEKTLFEKQSEPARLLTQEKIRAVTASRSEIKFTVKDVTLQKLQQLKDLVGDLPLETLFDQALDVLLLVEKKKRGVLPATIRETKNKALTKSEAQVTNFIHAAQGRPADKAPAKKSIEVKNQTQTKVQLRSRFIPIEFKRLVFARSKGQCEFADPRVKTRCHSRFRLQIDHVLPFALGGETKASNLRHLCSAHNLRMAIQAGLHEPSNRIHHE